jgi:NADP-dependent 3-hydroxy acid dehydrogenase YdfG
MSSHTNKQPWALILGASSGFGEASAVELARAGMNIFGVHMDGAKAPARRRSAGAIARWGASASSSVSMRG